MKRIVAASIGAVMSVTVCSQTATVWDRLTERSGWILLGYINVAQQSWATERHHEMVKESTSGEELVPKVGDHLRMTADARLVIVGYRKDGEVNVSVSPAGRQLTIEDSVGMVLGGSLLEVKDVSWESATGNLQGVWIRVSPIK